MAVEKATAKSGKSLRSIKLPGRAEQYVDTDPVKIARELRAKSRLGQREAKLAEAERKANG